MIPPIASKFIAGDDLESALENTQKQREKGISVMFNWLGEHYSTEEEVLEDKKEYKQLISELRSLESVTISVKPSQLGLDISPELFDETLETLVKEASEASDQIIWVDMEDSETTDYTLDTVKRLANEGYSNIGIALQANLKRTREDLRDISGTGISVRLVKGAYKEPSEIAYTSSERINREYKEHIDYLFNEFDGYFAVATHDPEMITYTKRCSEENLDVNFEFQMLLGVREPAQYSLIEEGYMVSQYAPYGPKWIPYVYRRLREGKNNFWFIFRNIIGV